MKKIQYKENIKNNKMLKIETKKTNSNVLANYISSVSSDTGHKYDIYFTSEANYISTKSAL